jgi:TonB family protein
MALRARPEARRASQGTGADRSQFPLDIEWKPNVDSKRAPFRGSRFRLCDDSVCSRCFAGTVIAVGILSGEPQQADQDRLKNHAHKTQPVVTFRVDPKYTKEAHAHKIEGTVRLSVVIGTDGLAHDINVLKPLGSGLDEKAVEAVQKWRFRPGMMDGEPVDSKAQVEVNFRFR